MTISNKNKHRLEKDAQRNERRAVAEKEAAEKDPSKRVASLSQAAGPRVRDAIEKVDAMALNHMHIAGEVLQKMDIDQKMTFMGFMFHKDVTEGGKTIVHALCQKYLPEYYFLCNLDSVKDKRKNNPKVMDTLDSQERGMLDDFLGRHIELDREISEGRSPRVMYSLYEDTVYFNRQFYMKHISSILGDEMWKLPRRW